MPPPFQLHTGQRCLEVKENRSPQLQTPSSATASITFGFLEPAATSLVCNPGILLSVPSRCWKKSWRSYSGMKFALAETARRPELRHMEAIPAFGPAACLTVRYRAAGRGSTHRLSPGHSLLQSAQICPLVLLLLPAVGRKHMRTVSSNQITPNHKIPHIMVRL